MSGIEHHLWGGAHHLHRLLHCNAVVFPELGQSPPTQPDPSLQFLPLLALEVAAFPIDTIYLKKGTHTLERSPEIKTHILVFLLTQHCSIVVQHMIWQL